MVHARLYVIGVNRQHQQHQSLDPPSTFLLFVFSMSASARRVISCVSLDAIPLHMPTLLLCGRRDESKTYAVKSNTNMKLVFHRCIGRRSSHSTISADASRIAAVHLAAICLWPGSMTPSHFVKINSGAGVGQSLRCDSGAH